MLSENLVVSALYLDVLRRSSAPAWRWPAIQALLKASKYADIVSFGNALHKIGFHEEAACLEDTIHVTHASSLLSSGQIITSACSEYPSRFKLMPLGDVPLALYRHASQGVMDIDALHKPNTTPQIWIAIVGTRSPSPNDIQSALAAVDAIAVSGYGLVSGGANGIDKIASEHARVLGIPVTEILPTGIDWQRMPPDTTSLRLADVGTFNHQFLSVQAPTKGFSTRAALERNTLIYAMASAAIVIHPRYKKGGSWHGASHALRRKICPVMVSCPDIRSRSAVQWGNFTDSIDANRALVSGGALAWEGSSAPDISKLLAWRGLQDRLFTEMSEEEAHFKPIEERIVLASPNTKIRIKVA